MFALGFPLLLIPFAIYNMIAFLTPGVSWTSPVTTVQMMSGQDWVLTWQDILLAFAIFLLWIELIKSTRAGSRSVVDHVLSMALFIIMLVEFLLVARAATSTFFLVDGDCARGRVGRLYRRYAHRIAADRDRTVRSGLTR